MNKSVLTFSVLAIVSVLATVAFLNLNDANLKNAELTSNLASLQDQYNELWSKYNSLNYNYSYLEWNYTNFLLQSPASWPNPGSNGTDTGNDTYQARLQALQELYVNLKEEYDQYVADYQKLRNMTELRLMHGDLRVLITPSDPEVVNLTRSIVGKSLDDNNSDINWGDIKALYDWVNNNIKYREDGLYPSLPESPVDLETKSLEQTDQMAQLPNETLALKQGDCEDTAVLLVSMLRAYFNYRYTAECVWITGASAGHVGVMIPFSGDKVVILDPVRDYYSHNTLGDIALNSASTEIYNWMNIWRPSLGNDVHVYRVFSDYVDKSFDTTEDFLNWMYSR
jgi:hypothetical protein